MPVLTLAQIDALSANDAFLIIDGACTMNGGDRVAYPMPDYDTAVTYASFVRRFLAVEQEDELDMGAAEVVCAAHKHYALTQYRALFRDMQIGTTDDLVFRIDVGISNWQQNVRVSKGLLRKAPKRQLELTDDVTRPVPAVPTA